MLYTLDDYARIASNGFEYVLPQTILEKINVVTNEVMKMNIDSPMTPTNRTTPSGNQRFKRTNVAGGGTTTTRPREGSSNGTKNTNNKRTVNDEEWNRIATFKATPPIEKSDKDVIMDKIRVCLNKISDKTYQLQLTNIIEVIDNVLANENNNVDMVKQIATAIFDIASNNKFYSDIYADLYIAISNKYSIFKENIIAFLANYRDSMHRIENVNPNVDYNKFCENNKKNDIRKAISTFITNIVLKGFLDMDYVIDTIIDLQSIVMEYMELAEKTQELEEITENLYILVSTLNSHCKVHAKWSEIIENIRILSQIKSKTKPGMSSRAIFKYMDIWDKVNK
jgi:hypothetical protein